jgi:hypothetical protein
MVKKATGKTKHARIFEHVHSAIMAGQYKINARIAGCQEEAAVGAAPIGMKWLSPTGISLKRELETSQQENKS